MQNKSENKLKDLPVCRTCLTPIRGISFRLQEQSGFGRGLMFTHILRYIVPELYLGLSVGPELCYDCKESLRVAYTFRKRCLETEALIGDYLKNKKCTNKVIELSSVIEYIKQFKGKLDAERILSEWNDDSIEDFPQDPISDGCTKEAPKSDMVQSEVLMTPLPNHCIPEPNMTSILSSTTSRHIIRKIKIPILPKPTEPPVVETPKCSDKNITTEVNKENQTSTAPVQQQRVEVLKVCPQTGLFKNKEGKYLNLEGEELSESVVRDIKMENNHEEQKEKEKPFLSSPDNNKEELTQNINKTLDENEATVDKTDGNVSNQENKLDNIVIENSMSICEETGLLRDQNGHYFDFSGNPLEDEQVEAEKKKAKIRGENLFQISNICTVSNEDFENVNGNSNKNPSDFEEEINVYQIPRQDTSKINTPISESQGFSKSFINYKENLNNTAGSSKEDYLMNTSPANILNFQADENLRIPQQWNPNHNIFKKNSVLHSALTNKRFKLSHNLFGTHLLLSPTGSTFSDTTEPNTNKTSSQASIRHVEAPNSKSTVHINPLSANFGLCPVAVKTEPLDELENNPIVDDNEDTLSAPDLNLDDADDTSSWQKLINSLDSCDNSQYVDVPDFVEIQNFSLEDYLKLKKHAKVQDGKEKSENLKVTMLNSNKKISLLKPSQNVEKKPYSLPDQFMYRGKLLVRTEDGYKLDVGAATIDAEKQQVDEQRNSATVAQLPMSNAEKCKNYRNRKKEANTIDKKVKDKCSLTKTNAEICRMYRMRKKIFPQGYKPILPKDSTMALGASSPPAIAGSQKGKKMKISTVRKEQKVSAKVQLVDRELCVLFTHYTKDGFYVNDHDYLTSPYARNNLLTVEGKTRYCMCFICGVKHLLKDHVVHMNLHRSTCSKCSINLGTPYMLNLHMKIHSKSCKYCTEVVPLSMIQNHLSKHEEEEKSDQDNMYKQKNKRKRRGIEHEGDEEERFSGISPSSSRPRRLREKITRMRRETRNSGKSEDFSLKNQIKLEDPLSLENSPVRRRGRKSKISTVQDTVTIDCNPYVYLERLPDHLINQADVQQILDAAETEVNLSSNSNALDINNYKIEINEAIKIKTEPIQKVCEQEEETDVKEDNDNSKTSKITALPVKEVGRKRERLNLKVEENDEIIPEKRVLRSRSRKKEENDNKTSNLNITDLKVKSIYRIDEIEENSLTDDKSTSSESYKIEEDDEEEEESMDDD